ncbi:MAG: hypothetical protein AM326_07110 [Candidatus Thorarchaeota archaeon SMTZ-45]|nr:MAG: hypothetical protein AM325_02680 [Candidatus Thorarchaeota archaeon SMTZ1-45]KXH76379.1 MAG: hypothetical protein AM326_07110 [Candidatus Thorarchaeota archaeon SMTZ-45]
MRGGYGRSGSRGRWPGNGPFQDLPPWERPGWLYGRGSCWYMGYRPGIDYTVQPFSVANNLQSLQSQKKLLEEQIRSLQDRLKNIEKHLSEIQKQE